MFKIEVKGNRLYALQRDYLTSGSVEVQKVEFIFSSDWDEFAKEAVFKLESGRAYSVVPDALNQCVIPWELLKASDDILYVGIYGTKETQVMTTNYLSLGKIHEGTDDSAEEPDPPPTPDIYRQLINMTETALQEVEGLKEEAASGAFNGPPGPEGPPGAPGADGKDGQDGKDGKDGLNGKDGVDGTDGLNGTDGKDGVSPIVTVTDIDGGHEVVIKDAVGEKSFNVMDGETKVDESVENGTAIFHTVAWTPESGKTYWVSKSELIGKVPELGIPFLGVLVDLTKDPSEVYICRLWSIDEREDQIQFSVLDVYNYPINRELGLSDGTLIVAYRAAKPIVNDEYVYDSNQVVGRIPQSNSQCRGFIYTPDGVYFCSFDVKDVPEGGSVRAMIKEVKRLDDTGSSSSSEVIYSTDEVKIGTWIDGKALYRRIIPFEDVAVKAGIGANSVSVTIEDFGIDSIINGHCSFKSSSYGTSSVGGVEWLIQNATLQLWTPNHISSSAYTATGYYILEYTKTTE